MNVLIGAVIVGVAAALSIVAMLAVRRRAPDGGYFADGDRAAGVFGVLATGFSVLLGFLIFLAFESYDAARVGAETEALLVAQQIETAQLLQADLRDELASGLVCYARYVIAGEWDDHAPGEKINPWGVALFRATEQMAPASATEEAAYAKWLDQTSTREEARRDRIHGAAGLIPSPLWVVLFFTAVIIFVFLLFFADSGERAVVQALLMGSVVSVIVAMLLLLRFLDDPFHTGVGGLRPAAMERTELIINQALAAVGQDLSPPCDESGAAL